MYNIAIIFLAGSEAQNRCFWPSYIRCHSGYKHDLIVVHRNGIGLPTNIYNTSGGKIIYENKINKKGEDIPHRAFGAYRHYYNIYAREYDLFVFLSDDVVLKRQDWLKDIVDCMFYHAKIGFGGSQIFNGNKRYPHPSHVRAPFWFAKSSALSQIVWEFEHDHDGEMKIGDQLSEAGFIGLQVGNKINLGYDVFEPDHITTLLEKKFFSNKYPTGIYSDNELNFFDALFQKLDVAEIESMNIVSPYSHIGLQNCIIDIEPFEGLVYLPSLKIAQQHLNIKNDRFCFYLEKTP
jgi:hypothetical protein